MKSEVQMEREVLLQQVNHQRTKLEADIKSLQGEESSLKEKLTLVIKVRIWSLHSLLNGKYVMSGLAVCPLLEK